MRRVVRRRDHVTPRVAHGPARAVSVVGQRVQQAVRRAVTHVGSEVCGDETRVALQLLRQQELIHDLVTQQGAVRVSIK